MQKFLAIARDLREQLDAGVWAPGEKLPPVRELAERYRVHPPTVGEATSTLARWGYVQKRPRSGVVVLDRTAPKIPLTIGRAIHHNDLGYYYNDAAGHWSPCATPDRAWVQLDHDIARRLERPVGHTALARHRVVGPGDDPAQTTTTYLPSPLGELFDTDDTGPGGWMQTLERDMGHGPLRWQCAVSSRFPTEREAVDLDLPADASVLVLVFTVTSRKSSLPVAVDVMTFDGSRFEIEYPVPRAREAKWPPPPATGRNLPLDDHTE